MNTKIFNLLIKKLENSFNLPKYDTIKSSLCENTVIQELPWTPARYHKFEQSIARELQFDQLDLSGNLQSIVDRLDRRYLNRFFSEIWQPNTEMYTYSGWQIVTDVNSLGPKKVLDVGCGFNQFKNRIHNLIGIDPYNNSADYQVDILDFVDDLESFDVIIALGSINFNSKEDIELRFGKCVSLLAKNGRMFFRANPGISHKNGPWIDIFPWSFEIAQTFAKKYNLKLETFKKDANNRLYFVYLK